MVPFPAMLARRSLSPCLMLGAILACCGEADLTALDLSLVADPNLNSEQRLAESLERLRLVLDAAAGLYDDTSERSRDNVVIRDLDGDGKVELEATLDLKNTERLPLVRVEQGGLASVDLEIRVEGLAASEPSIAAGGVQGVRFSEGKILPVTLPFNLKPQFLPPRVAQVFPEDGSSDGSQAGIASVMLIFSKAMSLQSLRQDGVLRVLRQNNGSEEVVPHTSLQLGELFAGGPTKAELVFEHPLDMGTYRVRVSTEAQDESGRGLDQVAMQPDDQPFASQFSTSGAQMSQGTCRQGEPCPTDPCHEGGEACPVGATCDKASSTCTPTSCPASCEPGLVCDQALKTCVIDCRPYGIFGGCPDERPVCQQDGLCTDS